jgi:mercuric ion transport protein
MKVEVICDPDCPNVPEARTQLLRAFAEVGISPSWIEWNRDSTAAPIYARAFGSPTVLVNGQDVSEGTPTSGKACCRLYPDASGTLRGAPSVEQIVVALNACLLDSHSPSLSHPAPEGQRTLTEPGHKGRSTL